MGTQDFIATVAPLAVQDMNKNGVLASITLAQAILESGWGSSELARQAFNYFGMKASLSGNTWPGSVWDGSIYTKETAEQREDGTYYTVLAGFRKYNTIAESVADHSAYLTGAMNGSQLRYAGLKGERDARKAITIIKNGGYATSLDYVEKVINIITQYGLTQYDAAGSTTEPIKAVSIMLDAGHYGKYNKSPANSAYYESDFTWKFHTFLEAELEERGFTVGITRQNQETDRALYDRGAAAKGYDLFISIHSNAAGSGVNNAVDYPLAITMVKDDKTVIDEVSKAAGELLAGTVERCMKTKQAARTTTKKSGNDRDGNGILDDEYYGVLNGAKQVGTPGIILEHSFHTCAASAVWLLDNNNLRVMAAAEADTLAAYYGLESGGQAAEKEPEKAAIWYRVRKTWEDSGSQVGAYKVYDNAAKGCPKGYRVYDDTGKELYANAATTHRVQKGDTLGKIAKTYGTTVEKIVAENRATYPRITADYICTDWVLWV